MAKWRDEKRRYRQYKARKEQLPASHHEAVDAVERYVMRWGPGTVTDIKRMWVASPLGPGSRSTEVTS